MSAISSVLFLTNLGCLKKGSCEASRLLQGRLAPALPPPGRQQVPADNQAHRRARRAQAPADKLLNWPLQRRKFSEERSLAPGEKPSARHRTQRPRCLAPAGPNCCKGSLEQVPVSPGRAPTDAKECNLQQQAKKNSSVTPASSAARYLNACMTAQVEVELKGVGDVCIHCCSGWDVPTLPNLQGIKREIQALHNLIISSCPEHCLQHLLCVRATAQGPPSQHLSLRAPLCSEGTEAAHPALLPALTGLPAFSASINTRHDIDREQTT